MNQRSDMDQYREEARAWVVRLIPGNATKADVDAFERWSAQDSRHARAFVDARRLWEASGSAGKNVLARDSAAGLHVQANERSFHRRALLGGALATTAAAGYLLIRPPYDLWPSILDILEADYRTGKGEQRRLTLADASIEMNTETSIVLRRPEGNGGANRIELLGGEGAFTTGPHPFEVIAGNGRARASNANFIMRRDGDTVLVTCTSGAVQIVCGTVTASLGAQRQVSYSDRGMGPVAAVDPQVVTAWQRGFLIFHDVPLGEVIAEINRYRRGRIILANSALGRRLVNARFRLDKIDDVVTKVTNAFGATATSLPGGLVIVS
jgi:transmembrane sensor